LPLPRSPCNRLFDNEATVPHNLCLEDAQGKQVYGCASPVTDSGFTEPIKSIEPGTYTYYCDVDGHREAGMEGTLTVK
jgi:plastocyanin